MGMKPDAPPENIAERYREILRSVADACDLVAAEQDAPESGLSEMEVQSLWSSGIFGHEWESERHGHVRILDFGEWNRSAGPDFLFAEVEIGGRLMRGDIEIDPRVQDWENHGHGSSVRFNNVILHVVLTQPPQGWFTRNSLHLDVPVIYLSPQKIRDSLDLQQPTITAPCGKDGWGERTELCAQPLSEMSAARIRNLMLAAAAHRRECKQRRYRRKALVLGEEQASFEAWAECLGYSANKEAMVMLTRRAPLKRISGMDAEAIMFGVAGFLTPTLPTRSEPEARAYHRRVWDAWWKLKDHFALDGGRSPSWQFAGIRPLNHPHRRVAALAVSAMHWSQITSLLSARQSKQLIKTLCGLRHPFWETHCMIDSPALQKPRAIVGRERTKDFLCNHVYVQDHTQEAWEAFTRLKCQALPSRASYLAHSLFGNRQDLRDLLRYEFVCQALLQIGADFCRAGSCKDCLFPVQLKQLS